MHPLCVKLKQELKIQGNKIDFLSFAVIGLAAVEMKF